MIHLYTRMIEYSLLNKNNSRTDWRNLKLSKFCGYCNSMQDVIEIKETKNYQVKDTLIIAQTLTLTCANCNEEVYDKGTESINDTIIFDAYKKIHNLLTSKEIIHIREKYGLSQTSFSKILGFGLKTITRYENGSIQDEAHDNLLRLVRSKSNFLILWEQSKKCLSDKENCKVKNALLNSKELDYS